MNTDTLARLTLATLPKHFRQIALWLSIVLTIGYSTGLVFVAHTTALSPRGVQERYRGNQPEAADASADALPSASDQEEEMKFEKSFAEMLNITHTHILAMASFLALAAAMFALAERPSSRLKSFLVVEPFVAMIVSFIAMWLMRYVHPSFSYLLMVSSTSMAICFFAMTFFTLRELVGRRG